MKKWFTLVELVVVITIIAILATLAAKGIQNLWLDDLQKKQDACILKHIDEITKEVETCSLLYSQYKCKEMVIEKLKCDFNSLKETYDYNY